MTAPVTDSLADWLRLTETAGVGAGTARKLLTVFGLPANIFAADYEALTTVVSSRVAQALLAPVSTATMHLIDATLAWADVDGNHVLTLADAAYPKRLLEISDPPAMLYAKGRVGLLSAASIAIVGSRNASLQGSTNAEQFAEALSAAGLTIISGMALGIDTAAHRGSLQAWTIGQASGGNPGSTVAVIGTGADIVYPARNRGLAHEIAKAGCILSEHPLGTPAIAANFPRRNRIISGLAQGVLVIEAAARSGSLITARMAAEQGRDVFAIPGSIHSPLAKGCHQLIKQGAKLVESAVDILEELQFDAMTGSAADGAAGKSAGNSRTAQARPLFRQAVSAAGPDPLLEAIGFDPVSHDILGARSGLDSAGLNARLLMLELQGLIELLPGGAYQRIG